MMRCPIIRRGKLVRRTDYDVDTEQPVHDEGAYIY